MAGEGELLVQQLVREFGRPVSRDPARRQLLDTLAQRRLLTLGQSVLALLAPAPLLAELAKHGVSVTVVESLEPLIEQARSQLAAQSPSIHWVRRDPSRLSFRGAFDLILGLGLLLGTTGQEADDTALLQQLRLALRPEGVLVLDLPNRELLVRDFVERVWADFDGLHVLLRQQWDLLASTLSLEWQVLWPHGTVTTHQRKLRIYSAHEVVTLCHQTGFSSIEAWGEDNGAPYHLWSPRLLCIIRHAEDRVEPLVLGATEQA